MATYDDRRKQYDEEDLPAAWRTHVAGGIRKKFADKYDFGSLSDQQVIQRHYERYGKGMEGEAYKNKLNEVYGTDFVAPPEPTRTAGDVAHQAGEVVGDLGVGLAPFVVPEVGKAAALKAGAKAVAQRIPIAGQIGFLAGHTANAAVDALTARDLEQTIADLPQHDEEALTQDYYQKLFAGLQQRGYSEEQIMQEARARALNITRGRQATVESIDQNVEEAQRAAMLEPGRAAADAFFFGVGAPAITGVLQSGLAKVGLAKAGAAAAQPAANTIGRVAQHVKTGVIVGAPGMGIQRAVEHGVETAAANKTPDEIGRALVQGGVEGMKEGAIGGALIGGGFGALEAGVGAAAKPFIARKRQREFIESAAQRELDDARLVGWQKFNAQQRALVAKDEAARRAAIKRSADDFDPHTGEVPLAGDPAEMATSLIQREHGIEAALSEEGMRAASRIEERIRLYQDANDEVANFARRDLPREGAPAAEPRLGPPLGPVEQGGRPIAPAPEVSPRLEMEPPQAAVGPAGTRMEAPAKEATIPAPSPSKTAVEFAPAAPEDFRKSVRKALVSRPGAAGSLTVHPTNYYAQPGVELFMTADRKTGYALVPRKDGGKELVSAFNIGDKGLGLSGIREAVARGATHLDAIKPLEPLYEKAGFRTVRTEKNYVAGQPDVVYMEVADAPKLSKAAEAIGELKLDKRATISEGEGGVINLERLGVEGKQSKPGEAGTTLDEIVRAADEKQAPIVTTITASAGPKGGMIPVEKLVAWYEKRGFKVTGSTKLPEGGMATATLRREPKAIPATGMSMLDAQRTMMDRAVAQDPKAPSSQNLAAPAREPAPGRWHQLNLWADSNIAAAKSRIKAREADFPEGERGKMREAGFVGEKEGYRDPRSYDWADFADRVHIGVNVILKHGLNKAEWVEHMVRELGGAFRDIADRVYQEAVAAYHARRPAGNDAVRRVVDDYVHGAGLGRGATRHAEYPEVDQKFAGRVADAYQQMKNAKEGSRQYAEAKASYDALNDEIEKQYQAMVDAGYRVTFTKDDPYPTSADMRADVAQNKHIKAYKTGESFHPFMTPEQNDKLRAVHDFYGHASEGYEFGPRGEDAAFRKHASTLSDKAIPALATETRGQNSWVNFLPENAKLAPKDRPFAEQKFNLLPSWVYDDVVKARTERAQPNRLTAGMVQRAGVRGDDRALVTAAQKLSRGVRPSKRPETVRARFVADGNSTVQEMMTVSPESATWYHDDIERMHKLTEAEIPSLSDPGHRTLFDLLLGFTSPNTNVPQNYARAFELMRDYERSGKVPMLRRFGQEVNIGSRHWVPRLNALIKKHDGDLNAVREYLLTQDPKTGRYNVERDFGDKVGPFTLNIQGIHDQITVDVWMVRRLRRLAGTLYHTKDGKRALNENWAPTAQERRDIEEGIKELSRSTGLDADAVQAVLWDNEKMLWERAGLVSPRIPFSVAAEGVLRNMRRTEGDIAQHLSPQQQAMFDEADILFGPKRRVIQ